MYEPDVALTDYALAIEAVLFAVLLLRQRTANDQLRILSTLLFFMLAVSSLLGGTYHGFFPDKTATPGGWIIWIATMLSIGLIAALLWLVSVTLISGKRHFRLASLLIGGGVALYAYYLINIDHTFRVGIVFYLPPLAALLCVLTWRFFQRKSIVDGMGIFAILLMFLGAAFQQFHIGLHPIYFNHNALYHLIQGIALALLFGIFRLQQRVL